MKKNKFNIYILEKSHYNPIAKDCISISSGFFIKNTEYSRIINYIVFGINIHKLYK